MIGGIFVAAIIALLVTAVAGLLFKSKGPWGSSWAFFLFMFLALVTASIYIRDVGPVYWGVAWVPLIVIAALLATLLITIVPDANHWRDDSIGSSAISNATRAQPRVGKLFWGIIIALIVAILLGMASPRIAL